MCNVPWWKQTLARSKSPRPGRLFISLNVLTPTSHIVSSSLLPVLGSVLVSTEAHSECLNLCYLYVTLWRLGTMWPIILFLKEVFDQFLRVFCVQLIKSCGGFNFCKSGNFSIKCCLVDFIKAPCWLAKQWPKIDDLLRKFKSNFRFQLKLCILHTKILSPQILICFIFVMIFLYYDKCNLSKRL